MKNKFLSTRVKGLGVVIIDVDEWKNKSEEDQYALLFEISRFKDSHTVGANQYDSQKFEMSL